MPKVIKVVVSDRFFEEHIAGDIETLATQKVDFTEGMIRMVIGEHFKEAEEIELNTDDVTDAQMTKIVSDSIVSCLTAKLTTEHGKEN